jgi:preprotein translocase subunit Sss1
MCDVLSQAGRPTKEEYDEWMAMFAVLLVEKKLSVEYSMVMKVVSIGVMVDGHMWWQRKIRKRQW